MYNIIKVLLISFLVLGCGGGGGGSKGTPEVKGATLGLAILALLNERFDVNTALEILRESAAPTFSFLAGVFGSNPSNFIYLTQSLINEGKKPDETIYVMCGPCRKPRRDGSLVQFHPELDIDDFNNLILSSPSLQQGYINRVTSLVKPLIEMFPEVEFTVIPELEDNLTDQSFQKLLELTQVALADVDNVIYQRNAVTNIVKRNYGEDIISLEVHTNNNSNSGLLLPGDAISFDGSNFSFPGESKSCPSASFDSVKNLILESINSDVDVFLWRAEWQGLSDCDSSLHAPPPNLRNYEFRNMEYLKELMRLRG